MNSRIGSVDYMIKIDKQDIWAVFKNGSEDIALS